MLPLLNGKSLLECKENDLLALKGNTDYRENEYLDYKQTFSFLECDKGKDRESKKVEFKVDVCSFANTDGGYLIYGVSAKNGCIQSLVGIVIPDDDTDAFELDLRNALNGIQPKIPQVKFAFIPLENGKYVVVVKVNHDGFSPYVYLENERNYRVYKRDGNGKKAMLYSELRQMFNQSLSLEQAIHTYVRDRISCYENMGSSFGNQFIHISFIPEFFTDANYRKNMFVLERSGKYHFQMMFQQFGCNITSIPCVEGLRYIPYYDSAEKSEGYVKNNGIVEMCLSLERYIRNEDKYPKGFLPWGMLWDKIKATIICYREQFGELVAGERVYICLAIVGCKNVTTDNADFSLEYRGQIDRDELICDPVVFNLNDEEDFEKILKEMYISYLLSIGVKHDKKLQDMIDEVYGQEQIK